MQYEWVDDDSELPLQLGDSAPKSGKKYVMYHGTTWWAAHSIQAIGFQQSADRTVGRGVYLSRDLDKASHYPIDHPESDRVVIKVVANVGKVIVINRQHHPRQKTWHSKGYDTAWVPPGCGMVEGDLEEMCVWDPRRIRILDTIKPRPVKPCPVLPCPVLPCQVLPPPVRGYSGTGPLGFIDPESSMLWAEKDFELPDGVIRLGFTEPESDKEYIMYHGTTREAAQSIQAIGFQQSAEGTLGRGVYLSRDLELASRYPIDHPESDKVVIRVVVNVGKVIVINYPAHPRQETWSGFGIDTAWLPPGCEMVEGDLEEMCVWDPRRIRIIDVIQPRPVPLCSKCGAHENM